MVYPAARGAFVLPGSCPVTEPVTVVTVDYSGPLQRVFSKRELHFTLMQLSPSRLKRSEKH